MQFVEVVCNQAKKNILFSFYNENEYDEKGINSVGGLMKRIVLISWILAINLIFVPQARGTDDDFEVVTTFSDGSDSYTVTLQGNDILDSSTLITIPTGKIISAKVRVSTEGIGSSTFTHTSDADFNTGAHFGTISSAGSLKLVEENATFIHSSDEQFKAGSCYNISVFNGEFFLAPSTFVPGTNINVSPPQDNSDQTTPTIVTLPDAVGILYQHQGVNKDVHFVRISLENMNISNPIPLGSSSAISNQTNPTLTVTPQGLVLALWEDDLPNPLDTVPKTKIMYAYSTDNGTTFINGTTLPSDNGLPDNKWSCTKPVLSYGGEYVYAAWLSNRYGYDNVVCARWDPANLRFFGNLVYLPSHGSYSASIPAIASFENKVYVSWSDASSGTNAIYLSRSTNKGDSFLPSIKVNDGNSAAVSPSIAVDPSGIIYVAWMDNRDGNFHVRVARSIDGGVSFENSTKIDNTAGADISQMQPVVKTDSKGNVYIIWSEHNSTLPGNKIVYTRSIDGLETFSPIARVDTSVDADTSSPSFALSGLGGMHIVWSDNRDGDYNIYYTGSAGKGSYSPSGTYISEPIYVGTNITSISGVSWFADIPESTAITFFIRASRDASLWSEWAQVPFNGSAPINMIISPYYQYRAELTSMESSETPRVRDVIFEFRRYIKEGTYISSTVRTSEPIQSAKVTWNLTMNYGAINIYLSNNNGADWRGVTNGLEFDFTTVGCQLRYRVDIISGEGSPTLNDITVSYIAMSFPSNVTLNFGCVGENDQIYHGVFSTPVVVNFTEKLNSVIKDVTDEYANIRLGVASTSVGKIVFSNLEIIVLRNTNIPKCKISTIGNTPVFQGIEVSGVITVKGTAACGKGSLGSLIVEVKIDSEPWQIAKGNETWSFTIDTNTLSKGSHILYARASDSDNVSKVQSLEFVVKKDASSSNTIFGLNPVNLIIVVTCILVAVIVAVGVVSYILQKKKEEMVSRSEVQPYPQKSTEEATVQTQKCALCEAEIPPASSFITCQCGRGYHKGCASRLGTCPHCGKKI